MISGFFDAPILLLICIAFCGVSLFGLYLELNDLHDEVVQRSTCVHILIVEYNQNQISRLL